MTTSLKRLQRHWDTWGKKDPLFAVLSADGKEHAGWDEREFFATGSAEIAEVVQKISDLQLGVGHHRALDFGCGVGRLSQALARYYDVCVGVDIAPSMIEHANRLNRAGNRCQFVLNSTADLSRFADGDFDLIYSNIVFQHIPPVASKGYIAEFVRVLSADGVAVFHCPAEPEELRPRLLPRLRSAAKEAVRLVANNAARLINRVPPYPKMLMGGVPRGEVERIVSDSGGTLIRADRTPWGAPGWVAYTYYVVKRVA